MLVIGQAQLRARLNGLTTSEMTKQMSHTDFSAVLQDQENQLKNVPDGDRFLLMPALAAHALRAGQQAKAETYARQILALPNVADRDPLGVNWANVVLGSLALSRGDPAAAKRHLLESANTKGTRSLGAWGPDTSLAQELIRRGESDAVLVYLERCKAFWKHDDGLIARWQAEIRAGKRPDLSYRARPFPLAPPNGR